MYMTNHTMKTVNMMTTLDVFSVFSLKSKVFHIFSLCKEVTSY